jgi:glycerol-3-phosphate dehydrogenase (NAD(P)+)
MRTMNRKSGKSQSMTHVEDPPRRDSRRISAKAEMTRYETISIIGDGGMATVLAMLLCEKLTASHQPQATSHEIRMWGYDRRQLADIERHRENKKFLPAYKLPKALIFEPDDERIMTDADLIISAVPCQFMRPVWTRLKEYVPKGTPIVSVAKGIENDTLLRPTQILADVLGEETVDRNSLENARTATPNAKRNKQYAIRNTRYAVLSGPTIADELARRLPATACAASANAELARRIQHTFTCPWLRVYTNTDIIGVELASACKNIIAIAGGIIDGIGAGDNAKAALLTRGLAEITRLGVACGAKPQTFAGLTGLGDLVTTCISPTGRNRSFGERIGKGQTPKQAENATDSVVEGIATCKSVVALAARRHVEMPIAHAVYKVLFEDKPVQTAIEELMSRRLRAE